VGKTWRKKIVRECVLFLGLPTLDLIEGRRKTRIAQEQWERATGRSPPRSRYLNKYLIDVSS